MIWIGALNAALAAGDTPKTAALLRQATQFEPTHFRTEIEVPRFVQALNDGIARLRGVLPGLGHELDLRTLADRLAQGSISQTTTIPFT